jgi:peptide/nickel transport system substrate-binding protein
VRLNPLKFLLWLCLLVLASCRAPDPHTIRVGLAAAPVTLDPRFATDAESTRLNRLLYTALVDFDENLRPRPWLAQWEMLTPTHYRFHLGAAQRQFHDGSPLNAEDVAATYRFILDPANASPHRGSLALIENIVVSDADTLDFFLSRADPLFPAYLVVGIVPRHAERSLGSQPLGSGPFRFHAWPTDGQIQLQRLADDQIVEFLTLKEPLVRVLKLLRGELDLIQNGLPPELIVWLGKQREVSVSTAPGSNFTYIGFNMQDPLTSQYPVRAAVAYALDRDALITYLFGRAAHRAGALLPPQHWAGHPHLDGYAYDPDKARALLAAYPREQLTLSYKTSSNPFRVRLATVLKYQLEQVGFQVDLRTYDWGTFYSDIKNSRFQMYTLSWVGIKTPDIFQYAFHSAFVPPQGANRGRFLDERADALIDTVMRTENNAEQARLYQELQAYLLEQLPYVPLWYEDQVLVTRPAISGYTLAADGNYDSLAQVYKH